MKLNNLKPAEGSTHSRRRIGRGPGSGLGGTSPRLGRGLGGEAVICSLSFRAYLAHF